MFSIGQEDLSNKAMITKTLPPLGHDPYFYFPCNQALMLDLNEALETTLSNVIDVSGAYNSIVEVPFKEKEAIVLDFHLKVKLNWDFSNIQSKRKTKFGLRGYGLDYRYRGDIKITPEVTLLIREPHTMTLIESITLDLKQLSVHIENTEPSTSHEVQFVLGIETVAGITDKVQGTVDAILNQCSQELSVKLTEESINKFIQTSQTIKN